jgi:ATP-dependent protease ClpP protease subunit
VKKIDMYVNSPGGSVTAGTAIYNIIKRDSATITAHVDAMAGSIMSVVVQAADSIHIPKNAFMFIHNPWTIAVGDSAAFHKLADDLEKYEQAIFGMYSRYKGKAEDMAAMMAIETLLSGEEAVQSPPA